MQNELGTEIQNTRSMSLAPESPPEYVALDGHTSGKQMQLLPVMNGDYFRGQVNYAIIVECWDRSKYGRGRRQWLVEFTQAERNKIASYYGRFYKWHLVSGVPDKVSLHLSTLQLLQRAVAFFAAL